MDSNYIYRNINENDFDVVSLLNHLTETGNITIDAFSEFVKTLNVNHQIIVVVLNDTIIASGTIFIENKLIHNMGKVAHIEDIVVHPNHRGKSVGSTLLGVLKRIAIEQNCYKISLNCNNNLRSFYENNGIYYHDNQMVAYI